MSTIPADVAEMMPDSVKAQVAEAEQTKVDLKARRDANATATQPVASAEQAPINAAPAPAPTAQVVSAVTPTNPAPVAPAPVVTESLEQKVARLEQEKADAQRQFDSWYGSHGSEVQQLKTNVSTLQGELDVAKAAQSAAVAAPGSSVNPDGSAVAPVVQPDDGVPAHMRHVTDEDIEKYGPEYLDVIGRVAAGVADANALKFKEVADNATARVDEVQASIDAQAAEKFWDETEALAPGAKMVNGDPARSIQSAPGWGNFLAEPVRPGSSLTRRMDAEAAVLKGDANAFATLVREFQLSQVAPVSTTNQPPLPTVASQAAPVSTVGEAPVAPAGTGDDRIIPQSEIDQFNEDAGKGLMTIEEANRKTQEYMKANQDGRVQKGA